jgi:hypothetical protein
LICVNLGDADAYLHEMGFKFFIVRDGHDLPMEPDIKALFSSNKREENRMTTGINYKFPPIAQGFALTIHQNKEIQQQTARLYCVGYVSYFDGANRRRITGFCRVLDFPKESYAHIGNCRFRTFHDPDYEYED